MRQEVAESLYLLTLAYVQNVSSLNEQEIMDAIRIQTNNQNTKSTWEMIEERGIKKGIEKAIRQVMLKFPDFSEQEIAETFGISIEQVREIKSTIQP